MERLLRSLFLAPALALCACDVPDDAEVDAPEADAPEADDAPTFRTALAFPNFPLVYNGSGRFQEVGNPTNQLVAFYDFDMNRGVNRETARYVDREVLIYNVFDMNPADGTAPDREYFVTWNAATSQLQCELNPFPLPNVFSRAWWLSMGMAYEGPDTINGFAAECWAGGPPGFAMRFCNRADVYPDFAPLLKKIGPFEFSDFYGSARANNFYPAAFFQLPGVCSGL